ncbi:MAG: hypothetical protein ACK501_06690 [Planctomycetota bacterium]|jgi:hypothetical protein
MPKVILDPAIPDNVRLLDYREYAHAGPDKQDELMDLYEAGFLLVFKNYRFQVGRGFFDTLRFPDDRKSKKMILSTPDNPHQDVPRDQVWRVVDEIFGADEAQRAEFQRQVVAANTEVFRLVDSLFPRYGYTRRLCIYNLTEMFAHNLHFDSPKHAEESTQLRMFVNLDSQPRIWHLSESLEAIAARHYRRLGMERAAGENMREFTRQLTQGVYGSRYQSGSHREHRHSILFQPGEVWCLNPNMTAHEVVYGRRLLDVVFLFERQHLRHPERFYPEIVRRLHAEHGTSWRLWLHRLRGRVARLWQRQ